MRIRALLGLVCLLVLLSGCEAAAAPESQADMLPLNPTAETAVLPAEPSAAPERESYPQKIYSEVMLEGYPDSLTLVLWEQTDYIIYFPENQWILEHLEEYGRPVDRWEPAVNPDITLRVVHMGPDGQAAAEEYLSILFPGYQWEIWKDNRLEGTDMQHFRIFRARLVQGQENYALVAEYPFVAVEGFGSHLEPVMDSIQLLP